MPTVNPFSGARFRALDANGAPLAGGLLYTYLAGTSTPQATYTDSTGATPNANPVVLDANGYADVWLATTANYRFVLQNSLGVTQWTVDKYPPGGSSSGGGGVVGAQTVEPGGRLTLSASAPVADVSGATTIYYLPHKSDQVPLYDGTSWALYSIGSGISQATTDNTKSPAAVANNSNYDLFIWNNAGTIRVSRGPLWTSDTARGVGVGTTELVQQNGRLVNKNAITNGPAALTGLYVGTVRSNGSAHIVDSIALRYVWNAHNRVSRAMANLTTATWTYDTSAWRYADGTGASQVAIVRGLDEDAAVARIVHCVHTTSGTVVASTAIGLDSSSAPASGSAYCLVTTSGIGNVELVSSWNGLPGLGYHYLAWLEYGSVNASAEAANFGGSTATQIGLHVEVRA